MVKKRIVSVLIVLIFALGVAASGILSSGFGEGEAAEKNTAGKNIDEVTAGIQWNLTFYEKNDLRNTVYRTQNLYKDSELTQGLKNAQNEAEVELNTPWAQAYYEFLEEALKDDSAKTIPTGFHLVYIDDNDVPELLIMEDSSHLSGARVCTYYQNKVVEIGTFGSSGEMLYVEKQGTIFSYYDDYSVTLYEIAGESVTEKLYNEKLDEFHRDDYASVRYDDAVFVDDMAQLKTALAQEIEALELKSSLTPQQEEALEAYEAFLENEAEEFMERFDMTWENYEKCEDYKGPKFTLIYLDDDEIPELAVLYVEEVLLQNSSESWHYEVKADGGDEEYWVYYVDGKEVTYDEYEAALKVWDEYEEKVVSYDQCFLMLDGNIRRNLNQAMAKLIFEENPFFYSQGNTLLSADIKYEASETWNTINGELKIKRLKRYDNGDLYKLSVEGITEGFLGPERKNIYLYVAPDEIYRLWSFCRDENGQSITFYDNDSLLMETFDTDEKLIENGELVCCMERLEDELGKEDLGENEMGTPISEIGKHFSIIPEGERITYSRYDTKPNGETDFYENFVWERGKGLVEYRSGFRAEAEILYIENIAIMD